MRVASARASFGATLTHFPNLPQPAANVAKLSTCRPKQRAARRNELSRGRAAPNLAGWQAKVYERQSLSSADGEKSAALKAFPATAAAVAKKLIDVVELGRTNLYAATNLQISCSKSAGGRAVQLINLFRRSLP